MCSIMPPLVCATEPPAKLNLNLPSGFEANIYAKLDSMPRMMAFDPEGNLFVTSAKAIASSCCQIRTMTASLRHQP